MAEYQGGGGGTVFQHFQPVLNIMQNNIQREQKQEQEREKERSKLLIETGKEIAQIESNGIRKADLEVFNKQYEDIKETYYQIQRTKNPTEIRAMQMELNTKIGQVKSTVFQSKEVKNQILKAQSTLPTLIGKGNYGEAKSFIEQLQNKPSSEVGTEGVDLSSYYDKYDASKVSSSVENITKRLLNDATKSTFTPTIVDTITNSSGKKMDVVEEVATVNPDAVFTAISKAMVTDKNLKGRIEEIQETNGGDVNTAINTLIQEFEEQGAFTKTDRKTVNSSKGGITINNIAASEQREVEEVREVEFGKYFSPRTRTFNKEYSVIGNTPIYNAQTGQSIKQGRQKIDIDGVSLMTLPVDANNNPLPKGREAEANGRYLTFVAGTIFDPVSKYGSGAFKDLSGVPSSIKDIDVLVPYNTQDFIQMSKPTQGGVREFNERSKSVRGVLD